MKMQGAVVKEQGVTFAVACVKPQVLNNTRVADKTICSLHSVFGGMPIVLMAQDSCKRAKYYGRRDISQFLSKIPVSAIPWREYNIN